MTNYSLCLLRISQRALCGCLCLFLASYSVSAASPHDLRLATKADITGFYQGSFKIEHSDDTSNTSYASGRVAYNPRNESVIIDSHVYQLAIGEFKIPTSLSKASDTSLMSNAINMQPFTTFLERTNTGNIFNLDRIGGMAFVEGELFAQAFRIYDTSSTTNHTTAIFDNSDQLNSSAIDGFYEMEGNARTVSYISKIPFVWRSILKGSYLAGNGKGMSISSRLSEGPSLYSFDPNVRNGMQIPTTKWLDYPVANALSTSLWQDFSVPGYGAWDLYNYTQNNDMWTEVSSAAFGFIIPGTRTFVAIGGSGMHATGGGYKIVNDVGYLCSGGCSNDHKDYHSYYWMYDLNDIINATNSFDPIPYEYGIFDDRFMGYHSAGYAGQITGGSFDSDSGTLILSHGSASKLGDGGPVISIYKLPIGSPPLPPSGMTVVGQ